MESSIGIAFPQACELYCRLLPRGPRPGHDRTLLSLCSCPSLRDDTLDTTVHGISNWFGTIAIGLNRIPNFSVFRKLVLPSLTLFSTFGVAGPIVVILDDLLKPRFMHRLVEFLVRGASLPLPSRVHQLVHRLLFPFCVCPSFPFLWQRSSIAIGWK